MRRKFILIALTVLAVVAATVIGVREGTKSAGTTVLVIAPLTGPGAALGESSRVGMTLALEDLGDSAHNLKLNFQDSRTDPKTAISILSSRQLHANSRIVISEMSQVTRSLVEPAEREGVLLLATAVGVPNIGRGSQNFVRVNVMSDAIAPPLARFAAKRHSRIAILYLNDDYGRANLELFSRTFTAAGKRVVMNEPFETDPASARTLVEKVRSAGVPACFITGYGPAYPAIFRAFKELAPSVQLYADIGLANSPVFRAVGDAAEGVFLAATEIDEYPPTSEGGRRFVERFSRKRPGERPDYIVAYSYDTVTILAAALRAVPSGEPTLVRNYLASRRFEGLGGRFSIDPKTGDSIYDELPIFIVRSGQIIRVPAQ